MYCILCKENKGKSFGCHHLYCENCIILNNCVSCRDIRYKLKKYKKTHCESEKQKIKNYILKHESQEIFDSIFNSN